MSEMIGVQPQFELTRREAITASMIGRTVLGISAPTASDRITLIRSPENRRLSGFRYRNAEEFFATIDVSHWGNTRDLLYQSGIVAQLALSAHLLDVGFDDRWCAGNIGLNISAALSCANSTGLGHLCDDFGGLALLLSPYSQWRNPDHSGRLRALPSEFPAAAVLLRSLLDRIREVTGHSPPRRAQRRA